MSLLTTNGPEPITVRIPEAVRLTGISRSVLYELIKAGELQAVKLGRSTLVPMAGLRALVEKSTRSVSSRPTPEAPDERF